MRIATLASLGHFGPPMAEPSMLLQMDWRNTPIQHFWVQAEERVEQLLRMHSAEVEAVAQALLSRGDLTGKECIEIMEQVANRNGHNPEDTLAIDAPVSEIPDVTETGLPGSTVAA
jgi:hypothetical protein